jgi:hypothetical protein
MGLLSENPFALGHFFNRYASLRKQNFSLRFASKQSEAGQTLIVTAILLSFVARERWILISKKFDLIK